MNEVQAEELVRDYVAARRDSVQVPPNFPSRILSTLPMSPVPSKRLRFGWEFLAAAAIILMTAVLAGGIALLHMSYWGSSNLGPPHDAERTGAPLVLGRPAAVTVARYGPTAGFPPLPPEEVVTTTSAATVARLVRDLNDLPAFPQGTIGCPFDDGSYYQVQFAYANGGSRTFHVERRGCQGVGLAELPQHSVAWSATDPRFLNDLDALFE